MHEWPRIKAGGLDKYYTDINAINSMKRAFEDTYLGKINTWDAQWALTGLVHNGLCIIPSKNLISNIGLVGVHFSGPATENQYLPVFDLYQKPLISPMLIEENTVYDSVFYKKTFHHKFKLSNKIREILARSKRLRRLYRFIKDKTQSIT
jgi:putative cell wall-binding protein